MVEPEFWPLRGAAPLGQEIFSRRDCCRSLPFSHPHGKLAGNFQSAGTLHVISTFHPARGHEWRRSGLRGASVDGVGEALELNALLVQFATIRQVLDAAAKDVQLPTTRVSPSRTFQRLMVRAPRRGGRWP